MYDSHEKYVDGVAHSHTELRLDILDDALLIHILLNFHSSRAPRSTLVVDDDDERHESASSAVRRDKFLPSTLETLSSRQPEFGHICDLCAIRDHTYDGPGQSRFAPRGRHQLHSPNSELYRIDTLRSNRREVHGSLLLWSVWVSPTIDASDQSFL